MEKKCFDQPGQNDLISYENIWKIVTGQGDDYTTCCLLDYNYFKKYHKMAATDLSKQQPDGHTTSNRRGFDVDITSIRRRLSFDKFQRHFHVLFRCNFAH